MASKPKDIAGQRFGSWTAIEISHKIGKYIYWSVICDCGAKSAVRGDSLRIGGSRQCISCQHVEVGNAIRRHGMTKTRTHRAWIAMRSRCTNAKSPSYKDYGGRGIRCCAAWQTFETFLADMGECPEGLSLERINVNGDYEPSNCRWADSVEQGRNRRTTVYLEANGRRQALSAWAVELGIAHITLLKRRAAGWTDDQIVNTPIQPPNSPKPRGHLSRRQRNERVASASTQS